MSFALIVRRYFYLLVLVALLLFPLVIQDAFLIHIVTMIFFYAFLASAWNLVGGYCGQFSLGHATFFGLGAYTSMLLLLYHSVPLWIGMLVGGLISAACAILIGLPCFRLRGPYFTLSSIGIAESLRLIFLKYRDFTGGAVGLEIPRFGSNPMIGPYPLPHKFMGDPILYFQFDSKLPYYYLAFGIMLLMLLVTSRVAKSKLGYYFLSIKEDQDAAESMGIPTTKYKLISLLISAFFTAWGGAYYAMYFRYIDPEFVFALNLSVEIALVAIIGGLGTVLGPLLGATLLVPASEEMRAWLGGTYAGAHLMIYGLVLMIAVLIVPEGIWPRLRKLIGIRGW
ncbi:MAG: branched-chain amino acid ABC transporter permease [Candidatus Bathyarchaeia archaeon]